MSLIMEIFFCAYNRLATSAQMFSYSEQIAI